MVLAFTSAKPQDGARLDDIKGYRLKSEKSVPIYLNNQDNTIDFAHTRLLDKSVFFRFVDKVPEIKKDDITYVKIYIPGNQQKIEVKDGKEISINTKDIQYNEHRVSKIDYDQTFWIDKSAVENVDIAYYRYRNDVILGALTLPFKFRPKRGDESSSVVDGSFNVGPYVGWKFRLTESRPFFVAPIGAVGVTSLTYNSSNNSAITDAKQSETGFGFQYGGGVVFDLYKIQLGLVVGADYGVGDFAKTYNHQNTLWMGFSLNFNFLNNKPDKSEGNK